MMAHEICRTEVVSIHKERNNALINWKKNAFLFSYKLIFLYAIYFI